MFVRIGGCYSGIEKIACRLQSVIAEIGVYIHCGGDLRVAEDLLNRLYGDTALKGDGCEAVPELMGGAGYSRFLPVSLKSCAELFFCYEVFAVRRYYIIGIVSDIGIFFQQHSSEGSEKRDEPFPCLSFWFLESGALAVVIYRLGHMDNIIFKIKIFPLQSENFAAAHAGVECDVREDPFIRRALYDLLIRLRGGGSRLFFQSFRERSIGTRIRFDIAGNNGVFEDLTANDFVIGYRLLCEFLLCELCKIQTYITCGNVLYRSIAELTDCTVKPHLIAVHCLYCKLRLGFLPPILCDLAEGAAAFVDLLELGHFTGDLALGFAVKALAHFLAGRRRDGHRFHIVAVFTFFHGDHLLHPAHSTIA